MRRILLGLALVTGAWADKVEGTLVQVQRALGTRVILCLKEGDTPVQQVSADVSQCRDIESKGLGNRWSVFCNRDAQGMLVMTSASSLGPDATLGPAFALVKQQIKAFADEKWSQALYNLAPDGRPPLATFSEEWKGTLLSDDPADWQVMCSNANRVTVMVNGTHASSYSGYGYRRGGYARRSSAQIDCQLQGGRWVIASMHP